MENNEAERFRITLDEFSQFILDTFNDCQLNNKSYHVPEEIIVTISNYIKNNDSNNMIDNFITKSYQYWSMIQSRNESFFIEHSSVIFDWAPEQYVNQFKQIFSKKLIDDEQKGGIWEFIFVLVKISIKYLYNHPSYCKKKKIPHNEIKNIGVKWGIDVKWFNDRKVN